MLIIYMLLHVGWQGGLLSQMTAPMLDLRLPYFLWDHLPASVSPCVRRDDPGTQEEMGWGFMKWWKHCVFRPRWHGVSTVLLGFTSKSPLLALAWMWLTSFSALLLCLARVGCPHSWARSSAILSPPSLLGSSASRWRRVGLAPGGAGEPPAAHVGLPVDGLSSGPQCGRSADKHSKF